MRVWQAELLLAAVIAARSVSYLLEKIGLEHGAVYPAGAAFFTGLWLLGDPVLATAARCWLEYLVEKHTAGRGIVLCHGLRAFGPADGELIQGFFSGKYRNCFCTDF